MRTGITGEGVFEGTSQCPAFHKFYAANFDSEHEITGYWRVDFSD